MGPRRAGSGAGTLYGAGLYLAECSSKSDEYAVEDEEGLYAGHCAMLLCRVTLGSTLQWETEAKVHKIEAEMARGRYESLLGDRQELRSTYREFILPTSCFEGAYPEYIIIDKRRYDPPPCPHQEKSGEKSPRLQSHHWKSHQSPSAPSGADGYDAAWCGSDPQVVKTHRAWPGEEYLTRAASFFNYPGRPVGDPRLHVNERVETVLGATTVLVRGLQSRPELNGRVALVRSGPNPNGRWHVDIIALTAVRRFICNADDSIYSHVDESISLKDSSFIAFDIDSFRLSS